MLQNRKTFDGVGAREMTRSGGPLLRTRMIMGQSHELSAPSRGRGVDAQKVKGDGCQNIEGGWMPKEVDAKLGSLTC